MKDLAAQKNCSKIFVWKNIHYLIHLQNDVHTSHIKNPIIDCTQLL